MLSRFHSLSQVCACLIWAVFLGLSGSNAGHSEERIILNSFHDTEEIVGETIGIEKRDYVLSAHTDQTMSVRFSTEHPTTAFVSIFQPGQASSPLHNGATDGNEAVLRLAVNGDYILRVYATGTPLLTDQRIPFKMEVTLN